MKLTRTANGLRLSQHGVVISELRTSPGPTHSVFDVLAALLLIFPAQGRVGLLGFAGGGMMAPLQALGHQELIHAVDLDAQAYQLFCRHCPEWTGLVRWTQADAVEWLDRQRSRFGLLVEDLSIPHQGDVVKPDICWSILPDLIRRRLKPGGVGIFNLLPPAGTSAANEMREIANRFTTARLIDFQDYQNRVLVVGKSLPSARCLGSQLRQTLRQLGSRQAARVRVSGLHVPR